MEAQSDWLLVASIVIGVGGIVYVLSFFCFVLQSQTVSGKVQGLPAKDRSGHDTAGVVF